MNAQAKKLPTPPYVPFKTFKNFLDKFKQGVPGRIDRNEVMGSMSGAAQSQLATALKYLGFISDNNIPQDTMKIYVVADGEDRKKLLKDVLVHTYPFIFTASFDLATATASQLHEAFEENTSATGDTVVRCIGFFKEAATDAGIAVSRFITQKKARNGAQRKRIAQPRKTSQDVAPNSSAPVEANPRSTAHIEAEGSLLLWGLFQRLPKPGSVWPKEQREQWTQTLDHVLALEYKEQ